MAEFDTTELLEDIRARAGLPGADLRFTSAKLLTAATLELRDVIAPLLVDTQSDRGVYVNDYSVTAGTSDYRLPSRALAARFRSVAWKGSGDTGYTRLRHLSPDAYYQQDTTSRGTPTGFFVRDYHLVLVPTPVAGGTLRVPYYLRPSTLVATTAAGVVSSVAGQVVTMTGSVAGFTSALQCDIVRGTPGFETLVDTSAAVVAGASVTFTDTLPSDVVAGDYVCLAGQSPVPQCPVEVRGLLAARAARRALKSVGAESQAAMLDADCQELEAIARGLLSPRADAEPQEWGDNRRGVLYGLV